MKQRFSSLDVKVIAHELSKSLATLRVHNIYDLSSKIFLIKFAKPENKQQIIIENGFRCHLTEYSRATATTPSIFVQSLRKRLKTRRVTSVSQVGTDRVIEFQFSDGQYRLFLEFYASGNIILTDKDLKILTLLRIVPESEGQETLKIGLQYTITNRQNYDGIPPLTKIRLQESLQKAVNKGKNDVEKNTKKSKEANSLRNALAVSITEFPPILVDHAMCLTEFDSTVEPSDVLRNDTQLDHLLRSLQEAQRVVQEVTSSDVAKGYIIAKKKPGYDEAAKEETARQFMIYDSFHPLRPHQFENNPSSVFLEFEGFNKTVDEFFSSIEGQKLESKLEERELAARRKIEAVRLEQARRIDSLQEIRTINERKASALQANHERVQEAMDAINGLIAQGMDWVEIGKLVEVEQRRKNPVASIIKLPLKLHENTISLMLDEAVFDDELTYETDSDVSESEEESSIAPSLKGKVVDKRLVIDVDLGISPWANARSYFDERRNAIHKEVRTLKSSSQALKSQEANIKESLKKSLKKEKEILRPIRQVLWFEKFTWFISSDGYLVLSGRDALQNETLYKKYLMKGDVYVHADVVGAAVVVIKNNIKTPDAPIPPSTLSQAGTLVVACSSAWDSKASMSAWWVNATQVSKSAVSGVFLPAGIFHIRGTKNFLPPSVLLLGFGILFQISDESKAKHLKHRIRNSELEVTSSSDINFQHDEVTQEKPSRKGIQAEENDCEEDNEISMEKNFEELDLQQSQPEIEQNVSNHHCEETIENLEVSQPFEIEDLKFSQKSPIEKIPSGQNTENAKSTKPIPAKRGKKGKAKKIAQKYKDQDEEDRIAVQKLIGAAAGREKALAEATAKVNFEAEMVFQRERRKAQHQKTQKEIAEHESLRQQMLEGEFDDQEEDEKMIILENLVGTPMKGDEILEAIPVCAPLSAMRNYKFKVKIQPGMTKKSKATKEILSRWLSDGEKKGRVDELSEDPERIWPRELELVRGWKPEETAGVIPVSKVRIIMAGENVGGGSGRNKGKAKAAGKGNKK
ncbi:Ribosome quality control complex subunit 2 [Podosphaera aphanis]|nr:Ribosome quality control complex subunit 2 [Podosphaera aphanis]